MILALRHTPRPSLPTQAFGSFRKFRAVQAARWRLMVLVAASAAALTGCASPAVPLPGRDTTATDASRTESFASQLDTLRRTHRIPGLAVVVLRGADVVLAEGYGEADLERRVPVTPDTPFDIASVAKPLSAVVALRLVERGQLDLDRPMANYAGFNEFAAAARQSGGPFFTGFAAGPPALTLRHVLSMQANGTPGTRFLYNPPSYSWASRPISEVAGQSFSDLTRDHVFVPAGMARSARKHRRLALPAGLASDLAVAYFADASGQFQRSPPLAPQGDGAAGGVVSTAMDLARFDIALTQGRLLTAASQRLMWTPGKGAGGAELPYGLGWFVKDYRGERLVWHTGLWEGAYSALYLKVPSRSLTLILLANSDGLRWDNALDEAAIERSPFAVAFLTAFAR
jgi:CubicO group peptidase (beta-lactamase class C family)